MSPPTKGEIKNGQSRETGNKWYTGHEKQKSKISHTHKYSRLIIVYENVKMFLNENIFSHKVSPLVYMLTAL